MGGVTLETIAGLVGNKLRAVFAVYGYGFLDLTGMNKILALSGFWWDVGFYPAVPSKAPVEDNKPQGDCRKSDHAPQHKGEAIIMVGQIDDSAKHRSEEQG